MRFHLFTSVALVTIAVLAAAPFASAKTTAKFLKGQYATEAQCAKLRAIEAGGPRNVETAAEVLDETGFHGWEGTCEFTTIFEHDPGKSWVAIMVCFEGPSASPATYFFTKDEEHDAFDVVSDDNDEVERYTPCASKEGK